MNNSKGRFLAVGCLAALVALVFWPVIGFEFVNYDDHIYVTDIPQVLRGLSPEGFRWALTVTSPSNWHPVTWLSHMTDAEMFGTWAGGHHLTNVLIHAAAAVFLFLVLVETTGAVGLGALAAALFAVHPLHVESVAWVAERKEVLAAFFWMLSLAAYVRYLRRPVAWRYAALLAAFALGLASKPMAVTLPFVLLLLDAWPLGRMKKGISLAAEKIPLFLMAAATSLITWTAQGKGGAIIPLRTYPLMARTANAFAAYVWYLWKTIWPAKLAVFYPLHLSPSPWGWREAGAAVAVAAFSAVALLQFRRRPYLFLGWFWFLGTLVPVIGLVQVGFQSVADRYAYLPLIGLFISLAWAGREAAAKMRLPGIVAPAPAFGLVAALAVVAALQLGHWRNSISLFTRAVEVTDRNWLAYSALGLAYGQRGRLEESAAAYRRAVQLKPNHAEARLQLGLVAVNLMDLPAAEEQYRALIKLDPGRAAQLLKFIQYVSSNPIP